MRSGLQCWTCTFSIVCLFFTDHSQKRKNAEVSIPQRSHFILFGHFVVRLKGLRILCRMQRMPSCAFPLSRLGPLPVRKSAGLSLDGRTLSPSIPFPLQIPQNTGTPENSRGSGILCIVYDIWISLHF